jgi:hypothetical protein
MMLMMQMILITNMGCYRPSRQAGAAQALAAPPRCESALAAP